MRRLRAKADVITKQKSFKSCDQTQTIFEFTKQKDRRSAQKDLRQVHPDLKQGEVKPRASGAYFSSLFKINYAQKNHYTENIP